MRRKESKPANGTGSREGAAGRNTVQVTIAPKHILEQVGPSRSPIIANGDLKMTQISAPRDQMLLISSDDEGKPQYIPPRRTPFQGQQSGLDESDGMRTPGSQTFAQRRDHPRSADAPLLMNSRIGAEHSSGWHESHGAQGDWLGRGRDHSIQMLSHSPTVPLRFTPASTGYLSRSNPSSAESTRPGRLHEWHRQDGGERSGFVW